jgi:flagellar protein FlgJ
MSTPTSLYTDMASLSQMKGDVRAGNGRGRAAVAEQVEGLFIGMVLKSMRSASAALGDSGAGMPRDLYDSQMALHLARSARLGFAELILSQAPPAAAEGATETTAGELRMPQRDMLLARSLWYPAPGEAARPAPAGAAGDDAVVAPLTGNTPRRGPWESPEHFVQDMMPAAQRAASSLGTTPEAVLAVAALETGWGRHMPRRGDGTPSYNLFGIKAHGWGGGVTHAATLEFEGGAFRRRTEPFRSYDSPDQAVADFAAFIRSQPRYSAALEVAGKPESFLRALHGAGYATDPRYGDKLVALLNSPHLAGASG